MTAIPVIDPENALSIAVAERLGACFEAVRQHPELGDIQVWRHPSPETLQ